MYSKGVFMLLKYLVYFEGFPKTMHTYLSLLSGFISETGMAPPKESFQFGDIASVNSEEDLAPRKHQKERLYWMLPLSTTCLPRCVLASGFDYLLRSWIAIGYWRISLYYHVLGFLIIAHMKTIFEQTNWKHLTKPKAFVYVLCLPFKYILKVHSVLKGQKLTRLTVESKNINSWEKM